MSSAILLQIHIAESKEMKVKKYQLMLFDNEAYHCGPIFDTFEEARKEADKDIMRFDDVAEIEIEE